jgi:hypothetical protein
MMAELVIIPVSRFDYRAEYKRPSVAIWLERAILVQRLFDILQQWNLNIDDVEPITTGKPSEQGLRLKLPAKKITMFFGTAYCTFTKDDSDWASAEEIIEILRQFTGALVDTGKIELGKQDTKVALHIQPTTGNFLDILRPFISTKLQGAGNGDLVTGASFVKWTNSRVVLDGSGSVANGIYLQFEQQFGPDQTLEEIAHQIRAMENTLFGILEIKEAQ